ncbi:hypothetical protein F511_21203 [Dorcoceras hygrometricum]|uniref:Uncharacterized protein n=1 Tax=Dorcoceras hygrometricum TaxID=472368 RepID=A0A2Z7BDL8_9LAMI|nr:hypothetical protein F511_21203 [Dorcoceras hygrometricum]
MADQTSEDEVFDFANTEFTREDLIGALNDMVKEHMKLSHSFEEIKTENKNLKNSSIESSTDTLEDIDSLKTELHKLFEIQKPASDRTGLGFNVSESSYGETSTQSQLVYDKFNKMSFAKASVTYDSLIHEAALLEFFENGSVRDGLVVSTMEISEQLLAETFELPVEGLTNLSKIPKDIVFDARRIISLSGEPVSTSGKKREMSIEFRLLCDILAKISVKAGSFDAITQEKFLMIAAITCGEAKGYAIQINLLLENVPNLVLGESSEFPSSKILTEKTVHLYMSLNDKVGGEEVGDVPRVKRTPVKKAASKKRPAVTTAAEPVVKKKRTTKSKSGSSKDKLEILPVAQEAVPLQIIEPTAAAPTEQPPVPKHKIQKRKRRLVLGSDDDIVEQPAAEVASETTVGEPAVEVAGEIVVEESVVANVLEEQQRETVVYDFVEVPEETVVENIAEPVSEPAVAYVANAGISTADDVDIIIGQVLAETAQIGPNKEEKDVGGLDVARTAVSESGVGEQAAPKADELEQWFNLSYEEFHARLDADRPIETASDTDEDMKTVLGNGDRGSVEDQNVQLLLDQTPRSSSSSDDSSMQFVEDDIQLEDDSAPDQFFLSSSATAISASIAALRESFSNLVANQSRDSRNTNNALSKVMGKIDHVERVFLDSLAEQNETFRGLFKRSRQEADIRNELLEFRVDTQGQFASLSTHLAELIAFLTKGSDDKKWQDSSSRRPQPPPENSNPTQRGMVAVAIEQMNRAVLLEVVLRKVEVREEETVVVPQK